MSRMKRQAPRGGDKVNQKNMMKQIQQMQAQMQRAQEDLEEQEIEGSAGGGAVKVVMTGAKVVKSVKIDPDVIDEDDVEMLEDLIVAAVNEANSRVDELTGSEMGKLTEGISMPNIPGLS